MKRNVGIALGGLFLLAAVSLSASAAGGLERVLELVPSGAEETFVGFTDWRGIKEAVGVPWLTGRADAGVKVAFLQRLNEDHAAAAAFGLEHVATHAEWWGFDSLDLEWEAEIVARQIAPTYVLGLRDDVELVGLCARFADRGFTQTESYGVVVYSRSLDPSEEWVRTTELAIHNTAVLEDERVLICSVSLPAVELFLATRAGVVPNLGEDATAAAAVRELGEPLAAHLLFGVSTCLRFASHPLSLIDLARSSADSAAVDRLSAWAESGESLLPYGAMAVGYRTVDERPVGTIAFSYADETAAEHDLAARRLLANRGASASSDAPISEAYFTLSDARVVGATIVFDVCPASDQPRRLLRMVLYADAPFAACR